MKMKKILLSNLDNLKFVIERISNANPLIR